MTDELANKEPTGPVKPHGHVRDLKSEELQSANAGHSAQSFREIAIGYLFLADITADKSLRARYSHIARSHFQLAETEEKASTSNK